MNVVVVWSGIGILFLALTWLAVIDIASKEFPTRGTQWVWGFFVCLVPFIGVLLYLAIGFWTGTRKKRIEPKETVIEDIISGDNITEEK